MLNSFSVSTRRFLTQHPRLAEPTQTPNSSETCSNVYALIGIGPTLDPHVTNAFWFKLDSEQLLMTTPITSTFTSK